MKVYFIISFDFLLDFFSHSTIKLKSFWSKLQYNSVRKTKIINKHLHSATKFNYIFSYFRKRSVPLSRFFFFHTLKTSFQLFFCHSPPFTCRYLLNLLFKTLTALNNTSSLRKMTEKTETSLKV